MLYLDTERLNSYTELLYKGLTSLRAAGQKEYAGGENVFGNFTRLADELDSTPEKVLWTYAMKHKDGIASYLRGNTSQREDVRGRIKDLIVYLQLLHAMCEVRASINENLEKVKLNKNLDNSIYPTQERKRPVDLMTGETW